MINQWLAIFFTLQQNPYNYMYIFHPLYTLLIYLLYVLQQLSLYNIPYHYIKTKYNLLSFLHDIYTLNIYKKCNKDWENVIINRKKPNYGNSQASMVIKKLFLYSCCIHIIYIKNYQRKSNTYILTYDFLLPLLKFKYERGFLYV